MKICEDCIKQDVCKYTKQVEKYENDVKLPKPLEPIVQCKYKRTEPSNWTTYTIPNTTTVTNYDTNPQIYPSTIEDYPATGTLAGGFS